MKLRVKINEPESKDRIEKIKKSQRWAMGNKKIIW